MDSCTLNTEILNRLPKERKALFEKLEKIVDISALSKEEREKYDESIKVYRDTMATVAYTIQKEQEALEKEKKAMEIGMEKGVEKGHKEEKLEVARNLKSLGMDTSFICQATGLKPEEVEKL